MPGYNEAGSDLWFGIVGPAGIPKPIVARLNEKLIEALRAPDMRQRKARIFRDRLVEGVLGAVPSRQHAVDAVAVMRRGAVGSGRQRQIVSVADHLLFPENEGRTANLAET